MCGFAGFLSYHATAPVAAVERHRRLVAMGDAIAHRGPDDAQYYDDGTLGLVYRRLAIVDVDGGRQPFFNEAGDLLLVANGEIYNNTSLRAQLQRHHDFASRSDCEVALHGYEEWGEAVLDRLHGMFALAVWNLRERRLTLARDRLGIKPLYLCRLPHGLLFGSELKALLAHPDCPRGVAWGELEPAPMYQNPRASHVEGIEMLPGGELLVVDAATAAPRSRTWWRIEDHLGRAPHGNDPQRYAEAYAELLAEAAEQHLQREVGAGLHLSGGVDSSLLAGLIARHDTDIPCFTVVERNSRLGGDVEAAQRLTQRLKLPWVPVRFDHRSVVDDMGFDLSSLEAAVWMMDAPRFELEWLYKEQLHRVAKARYQGLKVMFLGQGADEFAGGYSRRLDAPHPGWADYLQAEVQPALAFEAARAGRAPAGLWSLLADQDGRGAAAQAPYHRLMPLLGRQLQHHNLWHEDRSSSRHSLEARVPFLDHRLVELLASVPAALHEQLFWDKRIVRMALARFVPGHELRQPKIGFLDSRDTASTDIVLQRLLQRTLGGFRDKYLADGRGPFERRRVEALATTALGRGPRAAEAARQLTQCMAAAIFERHCQEGGSRAPVAGAGTGIGIGIGIGIGTGAAPLPVMTAADWPAFDAAMQAPPSCSGRWRRYARVQRRAGVEVMTPAGGDGLRQCFYIDGVMAGEIVLAQRHVWVESFLRNLGSATTRAFTLQDWLDEFDIEFGELAAVLDILLTQGVVLDGDGDDKAAELAPAASSRTEASPITP